MSIRNYELPYRSVFIYNFKEKYAITPTTQTSKNKLGNSCLPYREQFIKMVGSNRRK